MSEVRVFELAKELKMPAKQLLTKMRKAGIPVTGNFSELSLEQADIVRKMTKSSQGFVLTKSAKAQGNLRLKSADKQTKFTDDDKKTKTGKGTKIVTISTKSQLDEDKVDVAPKRRVRKRRKEPAPKLKESKVESEGKLKPNKGIMRVALEAEKETPQESGLIYDVSKNNKADTNLLKYKKKPSEAEPHFPESKIEPKDKKYEPSEPTNLASPEEHQHDTPNSSEKTIIRPEKKSKKTKVIYRHTHSEEDDGALKIKNFRRPDVEQKRKGGGGQRDYYNIRERRPRRRKKNFVKDRRNDERSMKGSDPNAPKHVFNPRKKSIRIGSQVAVAELAGLIGIKVPEILKKLMSLGIMATINQTIPGETAELIAADFDISVEVASFELVDLLKEEEPDASELKERAPIVTIMGHVDHGKTSLLDKIRETRIASGEAGGITQHIGAYHLEVGGNKVTFLDTPGHEAFTSMRARGANITDIVVLVVAADDKVQPQTVEAIQHARAANVPIVVAVNKIDRRESDPKKIQQELLSHELIPEDLGGSTIYVNVSAKTGEGIEELLEMIHLQAEILELKSTPKGFARGTIIESRVRKGQGPVGTVLVQRGTLNIGDYFVMGGIHGRIRAMFNEIGDAMIEAGPAIPVEISGLSNVPEVGENFVVLEDEKKARQIALSD